MVSDSFNQEYGLGLAYRLAAEHLVTIKDLEKLCRMSGAHIEIIEGRESLVLKYLGQAYRITYPEVFIVPTGQGADLFIRERLLILHYLNLAKGTPLTGNLITYKELPEGITYAENFKNRAVMPLVTAFGGQPERLPEAITANFEAESVRIADIGDVSITIDTFPRVSVTLVLWKGDEEFKPEANILFDASIPDYLSPEDITVLCETLTRRLENFIKA